VPGESITNGEGKKNAQIIKRSTANLVGVGNLGFTGRIDFI